MATATENNLILEKSKKFWERYSKTIIRAGIGVIVVSAAWIGYSQYSKSQDEAANDAVFLAEELFSKMAAATFNKDSVNIVLNGGNINGQQITGVLKVISKYGNTPTADRARFIAGASYLHIKEFDKAIKCLNDFDAHGATQVENRAYLMLGHAYAEKKNVSDALKYYKKSAEVNEKDEAFSPDSWFIYARYAEANGKTKEAIEAFKHMKEAFPTNAMVSSGEIDKYLARLGEFN